VFSKGEFSDFFFVFEDFCFAYFGSFGALCFFEEVYTFSFLKSETEIPFLKESSPSPSNLLL
jgi:hypothetical protein